MDNADPRAFRKLPEHMEQQKKLNWKEDLSQQVESTPCVKVKFVQGDQ